MGVELRVLGPLQVRVPGMRVDGGPLKQRLLLAMLLCRANNVVSKTTLAADLWDELPPASARKNIQVYVSQLRKVLGDRIQNAGYGYALSVQADELDLFRFDSLVLAGHKCARAGRVAAAAKLLSEAVSLRTAEPLADLLQNSWAAAESERLERRVVTAYEDWADLAIELGQYESVLTGVDDVLVRHPHRDRVRAAKMAALAGAGRAQEALSCYEEHRQKLAHDLGLDPSPALRAVYDKILYQSLGPAKPARADNRTLDPVYLPPKNADFVGRAAETQALAAFLDSRSSSAGPAVITGPIGIGKTALAVHVAHMMRDLFPDGIVVVKLHDAASHPLPASEVLRQLLHAVGLEECENVDSAIALWRSWLAQQRILVIVDDAPDEASVRYLLPSFGASRVLVTSRMRLSTLDSVMRLELAVLSPQEGLELLGRIIGLHRVMRDLDGAERLLRACALHPLAIRAAAARLVALPYLSCDRLAARLEAAPEFDDFDIGDISVGTLYSSGLLRLPPAWREAVRGLAALPGRTFTLDAVGSHTDVFEALIEANIVTCPSGDVGAHSVMFSMAPLVQRYALLLRET
ncbi:BTAD domain-containing putative transcriptional regulator [Nonomuraea purpurea]|uniref:BTAD domain-containing putative transcriptional regulator n=1 Tax=Nonomuraea purpurea TaxID=1849276 RepID=A0ABV8G537_9ACTN